MLLRGHGLNSFFTLALIAHILFFIVQFQILTSSYLIKMNLENFNIVLLENYRNSKLPMNYSNIFFRIG